MSHTDTLTRPPPLGERLRDSPVWRSTPVRWAGLLILSWLLLRPALLVTISLDDFINPFSVFRDYGASPLGMLPDVNRDVLRNGHFNFIGQSVGAIVFRTFTYLISEGLRYSLVYATTKFAVFVITAVLAARLLRTLGALGGRDISLWWSRLLVVLALFSTLQLHVAWSLDPVGSFPLSGYLSVAIGMWALELGCRALAATDRRSLVIAAIAMCLAILYYEINVAMLIGLVPIVVVHVRRRALRPVLRRAAVVMVPPTLMTLVLQAAAAAANRGYTGTDVGVGDNTPTVVVRALGGSLPASAWPQASEWLGRSFGVSFAALACLTVVAIVIVAAVLARREAAPPTDRGALALAALSPIAFWLSATLVQATTLKVRVETPRLGFVYNYYAYGSVGVVLAAILLAPLIPRRDVLRRARPLLVVAAVAFVVAQGVINDHVHREFGVRLQANRDVLAAYTDEPALAERCAALQAWVVLPYWLPYYEVALIDGMNAGYRHFHGEPFCESVAPQP